MRSSAFGASKNHYLAPYIAGSLQRKQHHFEAFLPPLKLCVQLLLLWYSRVWLISMLFSRDPFADVGRTILELEAVRFAAREKPDSISIHQGEVL
jgi:hypothetical protein